MNTTKTQIFFESFGPPDHPGGVSMSCDPAKAHHWHVAVGGVQASLTVENIGTHMPDMMKRAYQAGIEDERRRLRLILGIGDREEVHSDALAMIVDGVSK